MEKKVGSLRHTIITPQLHFSICLQVWVMQSRHCPKTDQLNLIYSSYGWVMAHLLFAPMTGACPFSLKYFHSHMILSSGLELCYHCSKMCKFQDYHYVCPTSVDFRNIPRLDPDRNVLSRHTPYPLAAGICRLQSQHSQLSGIPHVSAITGTFLLEHFG